jgi:DNA primase catalytic subunit
VNKIICEGLELTAESKVQTFIEFIAFADYKFYKYHGTQEQTNELINEALKVSRCQNLSKYSRDSILIYDGTRALDKLYWPLVDQNSLVRLTLGKISSGYTKLKMDRKIRRRIKSALKYLPIRQKLNI